MRVSEFQRYLQELDRDSGPDATRLSALPPSLMQDLMRFESADRDGLDQLEVLAAAVRHSRALLLHLRHEGHVLPLTVFPLERVAHCPLPFDELLTSQGRDLQVLHVEPAVLRAPGDGERTLVAEAALYAPLGPLLWALALRSARDELLPEIAGSAAYRVAPGLDLRGLQLDGTLAAAVSRLQRHTTSLREMAGWPGFDRGRATRMLNGLYLQAGLIVSRAHPAATNDGWASGGR